MIVGKQKYIQTIQRRETIQFKQNKITKQTKKEKRKAIYNIQREILKKSFRLFRIVSHSFRSDSTAGKGKEQHT